MSRASSTATSTISSAPTCSRKAHKNKRTINREDTKGAKTRTCFGSEPEKVFSGPSCSWRLRGSILLLGRWRRGGLRGGFGRLADVGEGLLGLLDQGLVLVAGGERLV